MNTPEANQSEHLLFIARAITLRGLAVMSVGSGECWVPGCDCEPAPIPWSYTIGLVERDHPEVVTFGLPPSAAVAVLNWVHDRDVAGQRIEPGDGRAVQRSADHARAGAGRVGDERGRSDGPVVRPLLSRTGDDRAPARPPARVGRPAWRPPRRGRLRAIDRGVAAAPRAPEVPGLVKRLVPWLVPYWYHGSMATNLRLRAVAEEALRREAERTGRSQQDLIREAVDRYLGLAGDRPSTSDRDVVVASGLALPARRAYEELEELVRLPEALTTIDLLDRDDRV